MGYQIIEVGCKRKFIDFLSEFKNSDNQEVGIYANYDNFPDSEEISLLKEVSKIAEMHLIAKNFFKVALCFIKNV